MCREKKFITSGIKADFFTVAVRTGGEGMGGVSLLLVEKNTPGVSTRRMKTQGWWISNTACIYTSCNFIRQPLIVQDVTFENVRVPVKNLIGKENDGFKSIMYNFNHERFVLAAMSNRYARVCLEDGWEYAKTRKAFGKTLIEQPVRIHILHFSAKIPLGYSTKVSRDGPPS